MIKVNIERRTVDVPASCLPAGTFFHYPNESREESHGILLKVEDGNKAVNLYTGSIVTVLDRPYRIIHDVEFRGWD